MRLKIAIPEKHVSAPVLDAGLEAVTRLNEQMLAEGEVPGFDRALRYGVKWHPEPQGDEHFDSAKTVITRKKGDCDDLAPYHAATLRHTGEDPGARAIVRRSGPKRWHAVVQRSDGSIDDPSKRAGMGPGVAPMHPSEMVQGIFGASVPLMLPPAPSAVVGAYIVRPQIAVRQYGGAVQARADLPWHWREHMRGDTPSDMNLAMTALHSAPTAATALAGAIDQVVELADSNGPGAAREDHVQRLCCIADALQGVPYRSLCHKWGEEHAEAANAVVGSLFGKIARGIGKLAKKAVAFVPGIGPVAATAMDMMGNPHHPASPDTANLLANAYSAHPAEMQDLLMKAYKANPDAANALIEHAAKNQPLAPPQQQDPGLAAVGPTAVDTSSGRTVNVHIHGYPNAF